MSQTSNTQLSRSVRCPFHINVVGGKNVIASLGTMDKTPSAFVTGNVMLFLVWSSLKFHNRCLLTTAT